MHGYHEVDNENVDDIILSVINKDLGLTDVNINDIQRYHRLGPKRQHRNTRNSKAIPRPIIFRFSNFHKCQLVFKAKRNLKGKDILLSESLTRTRYELLKASIEKYGKVWTNEGRVVTKVGDNFVTIRSKNDLS